MGGLVHSDVLVQIQSMRLQKCSHEIISFIGAVLENLVEMRQAIDPAKKEDGNQQTDACVEIFVLKNSGFD